MTRAIAIALWVAAVCFAQAPHFQAGRVLAGDHSVPLAPGLLFSIYGDHLGPTIGCEGHADAQHREQPSKLRPHQTFVETLIYPKQLCETQVFAGGIPAGLLYVSGGQINFKVPQDIPMEGTAELQVIYKGHASQAVKMPLGPEFAVLSLEGPAKIGMPVWLKVVGSWDRTIQYPFQIWPASFGCHQIEVRKDGKLISPAATRETQAVNGVSFGIGGPCGTMGLPTASGHLGRIPLHLRYRFHLPGTYEVRYALRNDFRGEAPPVAVSRWTAIEILPGTPAERSRWLTEVSRHAPTATVDLLTDFLPNILGIPDRQSLELLGEYLYHPDSLVRQFAMYGLSYWPKDTAQPFVRNLIRRKGPSDAGIQFLPAGGDVVVKAAIPNLQSDSPVLMRGAVNAVSQAGDSVSPAVRKVAEAALIDVAEHIIKAADEQTKVNYAAALGTLKDNRAGPLLWSLVRRRIARGQAVLALTWLHSPADLPKLAQLSLEPANGNSLDSDLASLPGALYRAYGEAAIPYLETMRQRSEFTWVRTNCERELALAGRFIKTPK